MQLFIYSVPTVVEVMDELSSGRAHIAAASLTRGQPVPPKVSFGPPFQEVKEHLVYRQSEDRPRSLAQANRGHIEVVAGSSHAATLEQLRLNRPELVWVENPEAETEELLYRLSRREFDYTIADSNEFAIARAFHPEIRIAFDLTAGQVAGLGCRCPRRQPAQSHQRLLRRRSRAKAGWQRFSIATTAPPIASTTCSPANS